LGAVIAATRADGGAAWPGALVLTAQLAWSFVATDVRSELPTAADRAAGDAIVARIAAVDGPVLSPFASFLPALAGKAPSWHLIALWDVDVQMHPRSPFPDAKARVEAAFASKAFAAIVDADGREALGYDVGRGYDVGERLPGDKGVFVAKTGWRAAPQRLLVPRRDP
jgi:hypothetical protein